MGCKGQQSCSNVTFKRFPPCLVQVCRSGDAAQRAASASVPGSRKRRRQPMGHLKWCLACAVQRHGHAHADQLPALLVAALHVCACATMRQASLILWADAGSERGPPWLLHKQLGGRCTQNWTRSSKAGCEMANQDAPLASKCSTFCATNRRRCETCRILFVCCNRIRSAALAIRTMHIIYVCAPAFYCCRTTCIDEVCKSTRDWLDLEVLVSCTSRMQCVPTAGSETDLWQTQACQEQRQQPHTLSYTDSGNSCIDTMRLQCS